ncbi:hypothetical protein OAK32_03095 [Mariniblastus sp.]|nr:hypothetical protein [Mariniblastus sp.]MDC0266048.1 hypothetical protein [Mariniblastus sp.]
MRSWVDHQGASRLIHRSTSCTKRQAKLRFLLCEHCSADDWLTPILLSAPMPRREHVRRPSHRCRQRRANSGLVPDGEFLEVQVPETQLEASQELQLILDSEFL